MVKQTTCPQGTPRGRDYLACAHSQMVHPCDSETHSSGIGRHPAHAGVPPAHLCNRPCPMFPNTRLQRSALRLRILLPANRGYGGWLRLVASGQLQPVHLSYSLPRAFPVSIPIPKCCVHPSPTTGSPEYSRGDTYPLVHSLFGVLLRLAHAPFPLRSSTPLTERSTACGDAPALRDRRATVPPSNTRSFLSTVPQ